MPVPVKVQLICVPGKVKRGRRGFWKLMRPTYWMLASVGVTTVPFMGSVVLALAASAMAMRQVSNIFRFMVQNYKNIA